MFILLTHARTGNQMYVKGNSIKTIRVANEGTLIILDNGKGHYVRESAEYIIGQVAIAEEK